MVALVAACGGQADDALTLRLDRARVAPGDIVETTLANRGGDELVAEEPYRLERLVATLWVDRPQGPSSTVGYPLPPGGEHTLFVTLPRDLEPGRYRLTRDARSEAGRAGPLSASAQLEVVAGQPSRPLALYRGHDARRPATMLRR